MKWNRLGLFRWPALSPKRAIFFNSILVLGLFLVGLSLHQFKKCQSHAEDLQGYFTDFNRLDLQLRQILMMSLKGQRISQSQFESLKELALEVLHRGERFIDLDLSADASRGRSTLISLTQDLARIRIKNDALGDESFGFFLERLNEYLSRSKGLIWNEFIQVSEKKAQWNRFFWFGAFGLFLMLWVSQILWQRVLTKKCGDRGEDESKITSKNGEEEKALIQSQMKEGLIPKEDAQLQLFFQTEKSRHPHYENLLFRVETLELVASFISDGLLLIRGNEILYANRMGKRVLGIPQEEDVAGMQMDQLISSTSLAAVRAIRNSIAQSLPIEFHLEESDRQWIAFIHAYLISTDESNEGERLSLVPLVSPPQEICPIYLIRAQDVTLLDEIQTAKFHFLGTLAHEVKTPVTSLTMAIRLLNRSSEKFSDTVHQGLIQTCTRDIDRLRVLIDEFMGASQLDSLSQHLNLGKVNVLKLISHSVHTFRVQARERKVEMQLISVGFDGSISLDLDAVKFSWVLSKLVINAIRHTPRGGKVDVCLEACEDRVGIRIRDTGPGISSSRLEKIFEKYSSHYDLRVGRTGSLGLSLAISRDVITAHGGSIEVKSELGRGTEFTIRLPIPKVQAGIQTVFSQEMGSLQEHRKLGLDL